MMVFTIFIISTIVAVSNAELGPPPGTLKLPHSPFEHLSPPRSKPAFPDWSPKNFNFQESFSPPPKPSEHPPPAPQFSSPWRPIGNLDRQSTGYRSETPRYPEYTPSVQHTPLSEPAHPPVQLNRFPHQHTALSADPSPPPAISTQLNRYPAQPPYNSNHFGDPHLGGNRHQAPGLNQHTPLNLYQPDSHVQFSPSSYDVPLYAPMYEPGSNEDYSQAYMNLPLDWASLANALGQHQSTPPPQRPPNHRYKIVFIKTPRIPGLQPPTTPPPPQDQEKTLIYVLVNKPEYDPATTPAPPPSTTPSRPEVYFIQYKTKSNKEPTQDKIGNGNGPTDPSLYEGQDMNQHRYGPTFS